MEDTEDKKDNGNGNGDSDSDESDLAQEDEMDRVVADDREELDNDIYAEEGYGALKFTIILDIILLYSPDVGL